MKKKQFNPKVSIVIPVYNGSNYLKEAIDSALAQTYENTEIIVINDGSNDKGKTDKICKSYGKRIRYFKKENGGVSSALNMGIEKMEGEYFSWLSHDDIYYPEKVEKQIEYLSHIKDREKTILYANYDVIDKDGRFLRRVIHNHEELIQKPIYGLLRGVLNGITLLIPREAFLKYGKFKNSLKCTQDYDMWRRMSKTYRFIHMEDVFTKTRIHPAQDSNKHPSVIPEGNKLWISMMESITKEEKEILEGSEYNYYREMKDFLEKHACIYIGAINFADRQMSKIMKRDRETMPEIKVTVLIPFYNRLKLLKNAIDSVVKQTYSNLEILLIDDGSTEDTKMIKKYIKQDKRIRLIEIDKNVGRAKARNIGIENAIGEYIAFLDSDDEFLPEKIEEQLVQIYLTKYNVSHTSYYKKENSTLSIQNVGKLTGRVIPEIIENCLIATPTVMIKRDFLIENNYRFQENMKVGEDTCFWLEILRNTKLLGIEKPLTKVNVNSESAANNLEKHLEGLTNILGYILLDKEYSHYNKEISILCQRYIQISNQLELLRRPKDSKKEKHLLIGKFIKLINLFKYQGVILTTKKIIWKYGPRIFNRKHRDE